MVKVYTIASLYPTPTVQAIQTRRHSLTPCRQLDNAVAAWPHDLTDGQILNRVRLLNLERAREEENGIIRWIVPEKKTSIRYFNVKTKGNSKAELPA